MVHGWSEHVATFVQVPRRIHLSENGTWTALKDSRYFPIPLQQARFGQSTLVFPRYHYRGEYLYQSNSTRGWSNRTWYMLPKISSPSGSEDETFSLRERATQGCRCRHPTRAAYTQIMALNSHSSCCGHACQPRIIVPSRCSDRRPWSQSMSAYKGHDDYKENDRGNCRNSFQSRETVSTRNVSIVPPISKNKEWQGK